MNLDTLLDNTANRTETRISDVELRYFQIAGNRLKQISGLTPEQLKNYLYSGRLADWTAADLAKVRRALDIAHRQNVNDMSSLFNNVTAEVYEEGLLLNQKAGQQMLPFREFKQSFNPALQGVIDNYQAMAKSTAVNETYKSTINHFINRLVTDEDRENFPQAMRRAIRELNDQGISIIEHRSGRKVRMDSAVRNSMMTEYTNIVQNIQRNLGEEIGADAIEISAHEHPADDHIGIQGKILKLEEFEKVQNGEVGYDIDGEPHQFDRAIGQWNCRHIAYSFIIGVSVPSHSNEELEAIRKRNESGITWNNEHLTLYEGEQEQRRIELNLRRERENLAALKQVKDTDPALMRDYRQSNARITELRNEYKALGATLRPHGIRMKMERTYNPARQAVTAGV